MAGPPTLSPDDNAQQQLAGRFAAIASRCDALEPAVDLACRLVALHARIAALEALVEQQQQEQQQQQQQSQLQAPAAAQAADAAGGARRQAALQAAQAAGASAIQARLAQELCDKGFSDFRFVRVPGDYYDRPLEWRRDRLGAASINHLCKSIIMENTKAHPSVDGWADPANSKYYVVIVQYTARLNADKLKAHIHKMNSGRIGKQFFNMRLCPEDVSDELSGYEHNAVSPIGIRTPLPVVLSDAIARLQPDVFWLGAGEVDNKVGISAGEFIAAYRPFVLDCTY